jgi:hypothetical protein
MIDVLEKFDKVTAAGILARAALSLATVTAPLSSSIANEDQLRARVIEEARHRLGLQAEQFDEESIEKIADYLDEESDQLISADIPSALDRLVDRGDLPSDLYQIIINSNMEKLYGREFGLEKRIIETTIKRPDFEQHFGRTEGHPEEPAMVSLFAKYFRTRWPKKDFLMLVVGQRKKDTQLLEVNQAWRIYPSRVDLGGCREPLDWLRRFTDVYGSEIDVNGSRAKFFNYAEIRGPLTKTVEIDPSKQKRNNILVSDFTRWENGKEVASLITAIDVDKYQATLQSLGVRDRDILEPLGTTG